MFQYDPNNPAALVNEYNAQVGALYTDKSSNAWAFLNDDREVVEFYLTDVDGEWADFTTEPNGESPDADGFFHVSNRCIAAGVTNVIMLHNHPDGPSGPCDGLADMASIAAARFDERGLTFRGVVVTIAGKLDGVLTAQSASDLADEGRMLLEFLKVQAANGDQHAQRMLPMFEQVLASLESDEEPDEQMLRELLDLSAKRLMQEMLGETIKQQPNRPNIFDLPSIATNKSLLN